MKVDDEKLLEALNNYEFNIEFSNKKFHHEQKNLDYSGGGTFLAIKM